MIEGRNYKNDPAFFYLGSAVSVPVELLSQQDPLAVPWDTVWPSWPLYMDQILREGLHVLHSPDAVSGSPPHAHSRSLWTDPPDASLEVSQKMNILLVKVNSSY